ncbi:hypothetical protein [Sphingomonas sp.]|uniref:hypothetical protein n=1 Tax=Sphingomonas sp. TaxID=28214 RepID=UPI003B00D1CE
MSAHFRPPVASEQFGTVEQFVTATTAPACRGDRLCRCRTCKPSLVDVISWRDRLINAALFSAPVAILAADFAYLAGLIR